MLQVTGLIQLCADPSNPRNDLGGSDSTAEIFRGLTSDGNSSDSWHTTLILMVRFATIDS